MLQAARLGGRQALRARAMQLPRSAAAFHAGPVLQSEEKNEAPVAEETFFQACLGDWNRAVPMGVAMAIPAVHMDVYMITAETQLFACFMMFIGTTYSCLGSAIGEAMDDKGEGILKEHHAIEDAQIEAVKVTLAAHQVQTTILADIEAIAVEQKDLMETVVASTTLQLKHNIRNEFVRKLDALVQEETTLANSVQTTLVEKATEKITAAYTEGGDKLKADALTQAMDALAGKPSSDSISGMYSSFLKDFQANLDAAKNTPQTLPAEVVASIEADMEAIKRRDDLVGITVAAPTTITLGNI